LSKKKKVSEEKPKLETKVVRIPKDLYDLIKALRFKVLDLQEWGSEQHELMKIIRAIGVNGFAGYLLARGYQQFKKEWRL